MAEETTAVKPANLWKEAKDLLMSSLKTEQEREQAERYCSMITSVSSVGHVLVVKTSTQLAADLLQKDYSPKFDQCLLLAGAEAGTTIKFECDSSSSNKIVIAQPSEKTRKTTRVKGFVSTMPLYSDYTFSEFVRGPSNSFAYAAAKGVVKEPGKKGFNPLFIYGGTGLGKTHLMQAIGNEIIQKDPSKTVCYLTAERFLNEYVNSLTNHNTEEFRNHYRNIDILLVDDIQFIGMKKDFQEEFFNTFNQLHIEGKQIVMTSDVAPRNLPNIEQRLIARFEWGMVQEIEAPSEETRMAILKKKSEGMNPPISEVVIKFIALKVKSHVRAMEGALAKVNIFQQTDPTTKLDEEMLGRLLHDIIDKEITRKKLTIDEVQQTVAKHYSVSIAQILSPERTQSLVTPRQMAMYIARKWTTKSLPEIATKFEKKHATIIHGVKNIEKRLDVEPELRASLEQLLSELGCSAGDTMD